MQHSFFGGNLALIAPVIGQYSLWQHTFLLPLIKGLDCEYIIVIIIQLEKIVDVDL